MAVLVGFGCFGFSREVGRGGGGDAAGAGAAPEPARDDGDEVLGAH